MKCPYCGKAEDKVVDSRENRDGEIIRRRRQCLICQERFTTYERLETPTMMVVKRGERRERFDQSKLIKGMIIACEKRPVSQATLESIAVTIERELQLEYDREIPATEIGEKVMVALRKVDEVAYVRFASVYRQFKDISEFMEELTAMFKGGDLKK